MLENLLLFFSQGEWYAMLAALLLGMGATEGLKRLARSFKRDEPRWVYPLVGYYVTFICVLKIWPVDGRFAHPFVAASITALFAPTVYAVLIAGLRRLGYDWIANIITGRREPPLPRGLELRKARKGK